jgi:hypothetical protein
MKGATITLEQVTSILAHQRAKKKAIEMVRAKGQRVSDYSNRELSLMVKYNILLRAFEFETLVVEMPSARNATGKKSLAVVDDPGLAGDRRSFAQ